MEQQQLLEKNFQKNKNIFFESINKQLLDEKNLMGVEAFNNLYIGKLTDILNLLTSDTENTLSIEQYTRLGNFAYLVGIGYTNQAFLTQIVCEQIAERFKQYEFSADVISLFIACISKIEGANLNAPKTLMSEELLKTIPQITEDIVIDKEKNTKVNLQKNTFIAIKSLINHSIFPVNLSISISEILEKKSKISYQELLTLNNFINQSCKFIGKHAIKNFMKVYGEMYFIDTITEALKLVDKQKFALVYQDGILSLKESFTKFDTTILSKVISGELSEFNFAQIKLDFEEFQKEKALETQDIDIPVTYQRLPKEEIDKIMIENPGQFLFECFGDFIGKIPETAEEFFQGISAISEDENYGHHIYQYLKANIDKYTLDNDFVSNNMVVPILTILNENLEKVKNDYKEVMELICAPIPVEFITKIKTYFRNCIEDLVLTNEEQKQFLISQIIETDIETYNHLQQIITLIETCDITGSEILSYVTLHKYLKNNTTLETVFEKINGKEKFEIKIAIYCEFANFFNKLDSLSKVSE